MKNIHFAFFEREVSIERWPWQSNFLKFRSNEKLQLRKIRDFFDIGTWNFYKRNPLIMFQHGAESKNAPFFSMYHFSKMSEFSIETLIEVQETLQLIQFERNFIFWGPCLMKFILSIKVGTFWLYVMLEDIKGWTFLSENGVKNLIRTQIFRPKLTPK